MMILEILESHGVAVAIIFILGAAAVILARMYYSAERESLQKSVELVGAEVKVVAASVNEVKVKIDILDTDKLSRREFEMAELHHDRRMNAIEQLFSRIDEKIDRLFERDK